MSIRVKAEMLKVHSHVLIGGGIWPAMPRPQISNVRAVPRQKNKTVFNVQIGPTWEKLPKRRPLWPDFFVLLQEKVVFAGSPGFAVEIWREKKSIAIAALTRCPTAKLRGNGVPRISAMRFDEFQKAPVFSLRESTGGMVERGHWEKK
jgi:hypothetical protein